MGCHVFVGRNYRNRPTHPSYHSAGTWPGPHLPTMASGLQAAGLWHTRGWRQDRDMVQCDGALAPGARPGRRKSTQV